MILPNLLRGDNYTKDALVFVYLAQGYPNTNAVQQARHLGAQKGWFILSGTRNDNTSINIPAGSYKLASLEKCYAGFTAERRVELYTGDYWENFKKSYVTNALTS